MYHFAPSMRHAALTMRPLVACLYPPASPCNHCSVSRETVANHPQQPVSGHDHALAHDLAVGQGIEGGAPVVEEVLAVDAGPDPALRGQGPDRLLVLAAFFGELAAVFAGAHPHHREALDQR